MKLSLKEFCEELSISVATGKNWIKLGKIVPSYLDGQIYFDEKYVKDIKTSLKNGKFSALNKRRNKKFVNGNSLYKSYLSENSKNIEVIEAILQQKKSLSLELIECLIAECAIQLFVGSVGNLEKYLDKEIDLGVYNKLVDDIISDKIIAKKIVQDNKTLFAQKYYSEPTEDVLGLLYISSKNFSGRKSKGAYYTPTKVVKKLVDNLFKTELNLHNKKVLDSSCGTGNFLLNLPKEILLENIFANDIDEMSAKITRLNLALKYKPKTIEILYENVTTSDFLNDYAKFDFDYIIGNPPWGSEFSKKELSVLRKKYSSVVGKNVESFDVFIEEGLKRLKKGGKLAFVLPQAILNVKMHQPIREVIKNSSSIKYISYLGDVFDKVQCPSVILELEKTGKKMQYAGMRIDDGKRVFVLNKERNFSTEVGFNFLTDDNEQEIIEKINNISNGVTLKNNASFALGIVTGDNSKYVSNIKTDRNERILKGVNITKFKVQNVDNYIEFTPEKFQQVAPLELYRAEEKLVYKFVSKKMIFAYDDKQTLTLNSCNILIPEIKELSIKYVMAVLNSSVAQFLYKKQFDSMKVLRSHIESIPLPIASKEVQNVVEDLVNKIINVSNVDEEGALIEKLDKEIANLYGLTQEEYIIVKNYA